MGLRCLLGHDFTEPEIERERKEDGDEVVTTVREVKTCVRCGETQVVSENTEVTTIEQLTDQATNADATDADATDADATDADATTGVEADAAGLTDTAAAAGASSRSEGAARRSPSDAGTVDDADGDDGEILDDRSAVSDPDEPTGATADDVRADAAVDDGAATDAATDDGVILDDGESGGAGNAGPDTSSGDPDRAVDAHPADAGRADDVDGDDGERDRGAWPTVDEIADESGPEPGDWPEHRGEDEGFSAEVGEGGDGGVEYGGGLTPESADPTSTGPDTEFVEAPDRGAETTGDRTATADDDSRPDTGSGITRGDTPEFEHMTSSAPTEYYCPECGMTEHAGGNSMRAGDVCPECKGGYVAERRR